MSEKTDNFIATVGALARNEYLSRDVWILPSVCIAQAALESGWNLNARTLFGIKGTGYTATTGEYYNGNYVEIQDSFRDFGGVANSVVGYYDFLRDTPRYKNALNNSDYKDAVDKLIHTTDGYAYATDPNYISKIVSIIEQYNLTEYDVSRETSNVDIDDLVNATISGEFGNGQARRDALGENYAEVQKRVNAILNGSKNATVAKVENVYTVKSGDSLWSIAERVYGNGSKYTLLKGKNGLVSDTIYPGQQIKY